jgi:hypothetical protein
MRKESGNSMCVPPTDSTAIDLFAINRAPNCNRIIQASRVRVLSHIKRLDDFFGDFLVRVVCECGACDEIESARASGPVVNDAEGARVADALPERNSGRTDLSTARVRISETGVKRRAARATRSLQPAQEAHREPRLTSSTEREHE